MERDEKIRTLEEFKQKLAQWQARRVTARSGYKVTSGVHPYFTDATYLSITVANRAQRHATVEKVWLTVRGKKGEPVDVQIRKRRRKTSEWLRHPTLILRVRQLSEEPMDVLSMTL